MDGQLEVLQSRPIRCRIERLSPEQITQRWDSLWLFIKPSIKDGEGRKESLLRATIGGMLNCWVVWEQDGQNLDRIVAIITTAPLMDMISGTRVLTIYSLHLMEPVEKLPAQAWEVAMATFKAHARDSQCDSIIAYVNTSSLVRKGVALGAVVDCQVLRWEV
jgi:hypothetical protein